MAIATEFDTRSLGFGPQIQPRQTGFAVPLDNSGITAPTVPFTGQIAPITHGPIIDIGIGLAEDFARKKLFGPGDPGVDLSKVPCPEGFGGRDINGVCIFQGSPADLSVRDAGDVGVLRDVSLGIFGLLSAQPLVIGEIRGRPVLRCPHPGLVLGKDNRCYSKKDLPSKLRKWPPHKCVSATDRKIKAIKAAGAAAKSLTATFKGSGFKISRNK